VVPLLSLSQIAPKARFLGIGSLRSPLVVGLLVSSRKNVSLIFHISYFTMRYFPLISAFVVLSACSNFEKKDLYGHWKAQDLDFVFNADNTFEMQIGELQEKGTFRTFGNNAELINQKGYVAFTMMIKSLKNNELTINMIHLGADHIYVLKRQGGMTQ
jgi:hypothetical protein